MYDQRGTNFLIQSLGHNYTINQALNREGANANTGKREQVIHWDQYIAATYAGGNRPSSVDIIFACNNNKVQLVECKYRVRKPSQIKRDSILKKVEETKNELISRNCLLGCSLAETTPLLFSDSIIQQAKSVIRNKFPSQKGREISVCAMTTQTFLEIFFP